MEVQASCHIASVTWHGKKNPDAVEVHVQQENLLVFTYYTFHCFLYFFAEK
jgi:hypothetical protein